MKTLLFISLMVSNMLTTAFHSVMIMILTISQTLIICLIIWTAHTTAWFAYILFLIFIGGLMVLFIYTTSLAANEKFELKMTVNQTKVTQVMILTFTAMILTALVPGMSSAQNLIINQIAPIFSNLVSGITTLIMTYLLVTLSFFTFHFVIPFIVAGLSAVHLLFLHQTDSNNPVGTNSNTDKIPFHPYFATKDLTGFIIMFWALMMLVLTNPFLLGDTENFIPAKPLVTPVHIQPEWYFLFAYAILRSIPSKLGGAIALVASIAILLIIPVSQKSETQGNQFYPLTQIVFWAMINIVILWTWIGARPAEDPYILVGQTLTILYFMYFMMSPLSVRAWDRLMS